jgi:hypothetical protein
MVAWGEGGGGRFLQRKGGAAAFGLEIEVRESLSERRGLR